MTERTQRTELMRHLHGELSPEAEERLRRRLAREPELAAELRRLEAVWNGLELPEPGPAPPGFAARVAARAAAGGDERPGCLEPGALFRPAWARAAAAVALAGGIALGAGVALVVQPPEAAVPGPAAGTAPAASAVEGTESGSALLDLDEVASASVPSLAEGYWGALYRGQGEEEGEEGDGVGELR